MSSWPTGIETVQELLAARKLQRIVGTIDGSQALLDAASRSLAAADAVLTVSPDDSYTLSYDAARKSLVAVLHAQGLRPTTTGGHLAIQQVVEAQFVNPPPRDAFRPFGRMRTTRHRVEYETISPVDEQDALEAHNAAAAIHAMASRLVPNLPVFTD